MCWLVSDRFENLISPFLPKISLVAVVGGGQNEQELPFLRNKQDIRVEFFGIEPGSSGSDVFNYLDLNKRVAPDKEFDLVLCSQVLEHIWDVKQGLQNLIQLTKPGGLIWIGCPASNYAHGSPDYYSAGYQPALITNLLEQEDVEIIAQGILGSSRNYFLTHALQIWASQKEHQFPFTSRISRYFIFQIPERISAVFRSGKITDSPKFATETFVLARRPESPRALI